jgi:hypothetical protein
LSNVTSTATKALARSGRRFGRTKKGLPSDGRCDGQWRICGKLRKGSPAQGLKAGKSRSEEKDERASPE